MCEFGHCRTLDAEGIPQMIRGRTGNRSCFFRFLEDEDSSAFTLSDDWATEEADFFFVGEA